MDNETNFIGQSDKKQLIKFTQCDPGFKELLQFNAVLHKFTN